MLPVTKHDPSLEGRWDPSDSLTGENNKKKQQSRKRGPVMVVVTDTVLSTLQPPVQFQ